MIETFDSIRAFLGPIFVFITGMLVLLLDLRVSKKSSLSTISILGLTFGVFAYLPALLSLSAIKLFPPDVPSTNVSFGQGMITDGFGVLLAIVSAVIAILVIGMSGRYLEEKKLPRGEFFALILFATAGAMVMVQAYDLVNLFVGLELLSVALYILAGFSRRELRSEESAVKYFLLGAFASGFLLYGIALVYGSVGMAAKSGASLSVTGHYTNLGMIAEMVRMTSGTPNSLLNSPIFVVGIALMLVGLGFKASIVPFHMYAPDVYQGAPAPVSAFLSAIAKVAAFAALVRVLQPLLLASSETLAIRNILWGLALATMIVGNVLAIRQTNLKRMLAYSSVAHAGYLLVGVLASCTRPADGRLTDINLGAESVVFYLVGYALMNIGAFAVIVWLGHGEGERSEISSYVGLARRDPIAAATLSVLLFSLAGIPMTAGFLGKLYVFYSAFGVGLSHLGTIGLIVSVIGALYYLNLVIQMYFKEPITDENPEVRAGGAKTVAIVCAVASVILGVVPSGLLGPSGVVTREGEKRSTVVLPKITTPIKRVPYTTSGNRR
jgi:NADH-quinone oxidoreductase subunit N